MKTLEKLIKECEYKLKSGKANYQNTVECDWLLRNLKEVKKELIEELNQALRQPPVISSVCTCTNAQLEKDSLVPVYCHNCNAYVQTDL